MPKRINGRLRHALKVTQLQKSLNAAANDADNFACPFRKGRSLRHRLLCPGTRNRHEHDQALLKRLPEARYRNLRNADKRRELTQGINAAADQGENFARTLGKRSPSRDRLRIKPGGDMGDIAHDQRERPTKLPYRCARGHDEIG